MVFATCSFFCCYNRYVRVCKLIGGTRVCVRAQSSLRQTSLSSFPKCNAALSGHLWALEAFQPHCKAEMVSPC